MSASVQSYIANYLRDGTAVGIVSFENNPKVLATMTDITSSAVRGDLVSRVPDRAYGGTGIGRGLQTCQTVRIIIGKPAKSFFLPLVFFIEWQKWISGGVFA